MQIFFVSQCQFLHSGITTLFRDSKYSDIKIVRSEEPREILYEINKLRKKKIKAIILVDMIESSPEFIVHNLCFLWNIRRMMSHSDNLKNIPCILLGNNDREVPGFQCLPTHETKESLIQMVTHAFKYPRLYTTNRMPQISLCKSQRIMMNKIIQGVSLKNIAEHFDTHYRNASSRRRIIMKKIGLRNKLEFYYLAGKILL